MGTYVMWYGCGGSLGVPCACPLHTNEFDRRLADVRCPMCDQPFCHGCFANCRHKCDWGGGVSADEHERVHELAST